MNVFLCWSGCHRKVKRDKKHSWTCCAHQSERATAAKGHLSLLGGCWKWFFLHADSKSSSSHHTCGGKVRRILGTDKTYMTPKGWSASPAWKKTSNSCFQTNPKLFIFVLLDQSTDKTTGFSYSGRVMQLGSRVFTCNALPWQGTWSCLC